MKIDLVNNQYQLGGAETVMLQLHRGLIESGHESRVHVAEGKTYPNDRTIVPLYPRLLSRLSHTRFHGVIEALAPRAAWTERAFNKLGAIPEGVVHIHNFHGLYAGIQSLASVAARRPVVWTFHRFWGITGGCDHPGDCTRYRDACGDCPRVEEWPICGRDNTAEQLRLKLEHLSPARLHIVSPSRHLARKVSESLVGRDWPITVIPNGVDPAQFGFKRKRDPEFRRRLGLDPGAKVVLIVNRNFQDPIKGYPLLQSALPLLNPSGVQFAFAGGNSDWAIRQLPPSFQCVDLGYVASRSHLAELYEAADIFLFSSPGENFPCVTLEAMSAKCCVVSTPTDGVIEQIEQGRSGLISPSFQAEDLAATLDFAIAHPLKVQEYADAARLRVEREFSEENMLARHLDLYRSLLP